LTSILVPIQEVFENRELSLIPILHRLKILAVLHQDILDGADPEWKGLLSADFSFLEYIRDHKTRELAERVSNEDRYKFQQFQTIDFLCPAEGPSSSSRLRGMARDWTSLATAVKICAIAFPNFIGRIGEVTKVD
jgi:hypothetical protein